MKGFFLRQYYCVLDIVYVFVFDFYAGLSGLQSDWKEDSSIATLLDKNRYFARLVISIFSKCTTWVYKSTTVAMKRQIQGLWSSVIKPGLTSWGRRRAGTRWDTPEGTASSGPHPRSPCTWMWRREVTVGPARCRTRRTATTLLQTPRSFEALILCQGPNKRWFKGLRKLIVVPITLGCWMLDLRKGVSVHGGFLDYQPV